MRIFCIVLIILVVPKLVMAEAYPVGTIGHLYSDCKSATQKASPQELYETYCGNYLSYYSFGASLSLYGLMHYTMSSSPESWDASLVKTCKENECSIENFFGLVCDNKDYWIKGDLTFFNSFAGWVETNSRHDKDFMFKPLDKNLVGFLHPGAFCEITKKPEFTKTIFLPASQPLIDSLSDQKQDWINLKPKKLPPEAMHLQCQSDIKSSKNNEEFSITRCGAWVNAAIAGNYFMRPLAEAIGFSQNLSQEKTQKLKECMDKNHDALQVAKGILEAYSYDEKEQAVVRNSEDQFALSDGTFILNTVQARLCDF